MPRRLVPRDGLVAANGLTAPAVAFRVTDANGNAIHSLNPPGATVCVTYPANIQFDTYGERIQYFTGSSSNPWSTLPGPYTRTTLSGGWVELCTNVTTL